MCHWCFYPNSITVQRNVHNWKTINKIWIVLFILNFYSKLIYLVIQTKFRPFRPFMPNIFGHQLTISCPFHCSHNFGFHKYSTSPWTPYFLLLYIGMPPNMWIKYSSRSSTIFVENGIIDSIVIKILYKPYMGKAVAPNIINFLFIYFI